MGRLGGGAGWWEVNPGLRLAVLPMQRLVQKNTRPQMVVCCFALPRGALLEGRAVEYGCHPEVSEQGPDTNPTHTPVPPETRPFRSGCYEKAGL